MKKSFQLLRTFAFAQFHFDVFFDDIQLCIVLVPKFPTIVIMTTIELGKKETMHNVALIIDVLGAMFKSPLPRYR